jgi:hypothetical protein
VAGDTELGVQVADVFPAVGGADGTDGKTLLFPSPLCVVKITSRCVSFSPRRTGRKERPSMSCGAWPPAASISVGRMSIHDTIALVREAGSDPPGQVTISGVRMPSS